MQHKVLQQIIIYREFAQTVCVDANARNEKTDQHLPMVDTLTYQLILGLGASLGLAWAAVRGRERASQIVNAGLVALLGAYLGGRLAYLLANQVYFQNHPDELFQLPLGGFAWPGALAGGVLALLAFALIFRQPAGQLADELLPLLVTIAVTGWLGCWLGGCAYGPPIEDWWGLQASDEWGRVTRRWPVQAAGALLSLGVIWLVDQLPQARLPAGSAFVLGILGISATSFFMSLVRADPVPMLNNLRLETWVALAYSALALLVFTWLLFTSRRSKTLSSDSENQSPDMT
jgi:prolipoprotein diacylglyceryltransferase